MHVNIDAKHVPSAILKYVLDLDLYTYSLRAELSSKTRNRGVQPKEFCLLYKGSKSIFLVMCRKFKLGGSKGI